MNRSSGRSQTLTANLRLLAMLHRGPPIPVKGNTSDHVPLRTASLHQSWRLSAKRATSACHAAVGTESSTPDSHLSSYNDTIETAHERHTAGTVPKDWKAAGIIAWEDRRCYDFHLRSRTMRLNDNDKDVSASWNPPIYS